MDPSNCPFRSFPRQVAITGKGRRSHRAWTDSRGSLRQSRRTSTQSAPVKSEEKTSSKLRGVRETHNAPGPTISRPQLRTKIALARIGKDGEHAFAAAQFRCDHTACVKNRSRRNSAKNPLLFRQPARGFARIVERNRDKSIDYFSIEDFGNESGTDALNLVRPRPAAREHRRFRRLNGEKSQRLDFLLHDFAGPGCGSAGSQADDQGIEPLAAGFQNFSGGRLPVDFGVCRVLELLGHKV